MAILLPFYDSRDQKRNDSKDTLLENQFVVHTSERTTTRDLFVTFVTYIESRARISPGRISPRPYFARPHFARRNAVEPPAIIRRI